MTGGRALAEMIRLHSESPIFGMGGFQLLPFYDAARELGLRHYLINDERCGAFAADAYARLTGRPGICDGTLGPGATNLVTGLVESLNAGIPVIVLDRRALGDQFTTFIGASNLEIGKRAAEYLLERLPEGGKLVELQGILGATATDERHRGFRELIASHPGFEVIYDQPGDYKRTPAKNIMDNALQAHPRIDAVYAHNDEMAIGAFLAARAVGRHREIIFIGIDGQGEAVRMIRNGELDATFVYPNGAQEAIEIALQILAGETPPKEIQLQTTRITKNERPDYAGF